jgi:hypothetical protein
MRVVCAKVALAEYIWFRTEEVAAFEDLRCPRKATTPELDEVVEPTSWNV